MSLYFAVKTMITASIQPNSWSVKLALSGPCITAGKYKQKTKNTYAKKIAFRSLRSLHAIFTARYLQRRLSPLPLDSRLLCSASLHYASDRLAAVLKVNEWNPSLPAYTHGADDFRSDVVNRLLPRHRIEKWKEQPSLKNPWKWLG